jgi:hypothetical protein
VQVSGMTTIPETLAQTLAPEVMKAVEAALAPPMELRARARFELEIEAAGEGTFVMLIDAGVVTAKKGFAKDPLVSAFIPRGGWRLLQRELQAAVDGFPRAPELRRRVEALKSPRPGELDTLLAALGKLEDAAVRFEVKGIGTYVVARGPVDEATRILKVGLDPAHVDAVLGGAPLSTLKGDISGDRGVLGAVAAALAPALKRLP